MTSRDATSSRSRSLPAWQRNGVGRGRRLPVVEDEVTVRMPGGVCDAAFIHPATGRIPAC